jgi:hypothetical protein
MQINSVEQENIIYKFIGNVTIMQTLNHWFIYFLWSSKVWMAIYMHPLELQGAKSFKRCATNLFMLQHMGHKPW